ncbi:MAG: flagellar biosynthesis protein FlhG [Acidobacteriota bacterium]|nr:flagellar biosynthesis protein FlhG [Acidobacteriota bacterium]
MSAEIWAIGGGKGGTGKSFLASGLAMYLAGIGKKITLIDADLGGANLHTILKVEEPTATLSDFFERKVSLESISQETKIPNLRLVIGDIRTLNPDSIKYGQRVKLYRHITSMPDDYVIIDLGAGSGLNTLDTFLLADKMITITVPESTSIDNLYHFLKKALFRKLNVFLADHHLKDAAKNTWRKREENDIRTIKHLVDHFKKISPEVSNLLENEFSHIEINVVVNQVRHTPHSHIGQSVKSVIIKYFGVSAHYAGAISYDDSLWKYMDRGEPYFGLTSDRTIMEEVGNIAWNLMEKKQVKLSDISAEVLL